MEGSGGTVVRVVRDHPLLRLPRRVHLPRFTANLRTYGKPQSVRFNQTFQNVSETSHLEHTRTVIQQQRRIDSIGYGLRQFLICAI
eukprot:COSAG05_NODE_597_length_8449_cov_615.285389_10_plen_86_part_00